MQVDLQREPSNPDFSPRCCYCNGTPEPGWLKTFSRPLKQGDSTVATCSECGEQFAIILRAQITFEVEEIE